MNDNNRTCHKTLRLNELIDQALLHQKSGDTEKALSIYTKITKDNSTTATPRLFNNMGVLYYEIGNRDEALRLFEKALLIDIGYSETWANLEVDAQSTSGFALTSLARRLQIENPANSDCICAEAIGLMHSGKENEAVVRFKDVLMSDSNNIAARERLAKCLIAMDDLDSAICELMHIISIEPTNCTASREIARIAFKLGDTDSAISILDKQISDDKDDYEASCQLAMIYQEKGDLESAISIYEKLLSEHPDCHEVRANLGSCFHELGEVESALSHYLICANHSRNPNAVHPAIFFCAAMGANYIERLGEWTRMYWSLTKEKAEGYHLHKQVQQTRKDMPKRYNPTSKPTKKKIGILTGDLGVHAVSYFLSSFLMNYDKSQFKVEVFCTRNRMDDASKLLSEMAENTYNIGSLSNPVATDKILSRELDLIIETSGFTSGSALHLLVERCAPVQMHWIGYHASTYMPNMDYFIGDSVIVPTSSEAHFTEEIIRLDRAWVAGTPFYPVPEASSISSEEIIIGAFSQIQKITNETLEIWGAILQRCPQAKLLIKDRLAANAGSKNRIFSHLAKFSVQPERIMLLERRHSWQDHMLLYNSLDLALDTTPWSAATTAFDALSMGVPLISLCAKTLAGRQSTSALWHLGRHEWIAHSVPDYIEKCCHIIENMHFYRKAKRTLQAEVLTSQLFDQASLCKSIEKVLSEKTN